MKQIELYIKEYEKQSELYFKKQGIYDPPRSIEEFEVFNIRRYDLILSKEEYTSDSLAKTEVYPRLLNRYGAFGIYEALKIEHFKNLNNALYQVSIHELYLACLVGGSLTYATTFLPMATAFACNNFEIIKKVLPNTAPINTTFYIDHVTNLIKIMYYKNKESESYIIQQAQTFLTKKLSHWQRNLIIYFLALFERNIEKVNYSLEELCKSYPKLWVADRNLNKYFAKEIHGLYRFAKLIDPLFFKLVTKPSQPCFFNEFEEWQEKENYPIGKVSYLYPEPLEYMNRFYEIDFPQINITTREWKKRSYYIIDQYKFIKDTRDSISQI